MEGHWILLWRNCCILVFFFKSGFHWNVSAAGHWGWTPLSAGIILLTHLCIEQSCVGLGSSWGPPTSPIQPELPGARPLSRPWLPYQLPFAGTGVKRWIGDQSVDQRDSREQLGFWQPAWWRGKKPRHQLEAAIHFFIDWVVHQRQFCHRSV